MRLIPPSRKRYGKYWQKIFITCLPGGATVEGFDSDNGPQAMLIQLLPSSTVAAGVRLKIGLGTVASEIPGGVCQPDALNSGGVREPSQ